ncbi:hypothetical protein EAE92_02930 [Photorhabdus hainanensis]|nr:hypothetical protein [Photorhabdus hainanensis]
MVINCYHIFGFFHVDKHPNFKFLFNNVIKVCNYILLNVLFVIFPMWESVWEKFTLFSRVIDNVGISPDDKRKFLKL